MKKLIIAAAIVLGVPCVATAAYFALSPSLLPCDFGPCVVKAK